MQSKGCVHSDESIHNVLNICQNIHIDSETNLFRHLGAPIGRLNFQYGISAIFITPMQACTPLRKGKVVEKVIIMSLAYMCTLTMMTHLIKLGNSLQCHEIGILALCEPPAIRMLKTYNKLR